jgi:hypothetical protein
MRLFLENSGFSVFTSAGVIFACVWRVEPIKVSAVSIRMGVDIILQWTARSPLLTHAWTSENLAIQNRRHHPKHATAPTFTVAEFGVSSLERV